MRPFNEIDLKHLKNIRAALLEGRFEFSGKECLEIHRMFKWIEEMETILSQHIREDLQAKEASPKTFDRAKEKRKARSRKTSESV